MPLGDDALGGIALGGTPAIPIADLTWWQGPTPPKRRNPAAYAPFQSFSTLTPPIPPVSNYFQRFSEPVRFKRIHPAFMGGSFANLGSVEILTIDKWFSPFSEPKRFKKGLLSGLQQDLARNPFVPISYTLSMDAVEQGDFLTAVLYQFNIPLSALVDIVTNDPNHRGHLGIIENAAEDSIVTAIIEPQTTPTGGSAVPTVAGARVAIIVT